MRRSFTSIVAELPLLAIAVHPHGDGGACAETAQHEVERGGARIRAAATLRLVRRELRDPMRW